MVGSPGIVIGCRAPPRPAGSTSATLQMEQERHLRIEYRHRQPRHGELSSGDLDTFEPGGLLLCHTQTAFAERPLRNDQVRPRRLMDESHESLHLDFEVTGPAPHAAVELARTLQGCIGARMVGAGLQAQRSPSSKPQPSKPSSKR